ncbi:OmpA family protein [Rhizobium jaguaris]|uniref:OmpA-like domain-containing protein n=1 Tax=Rhizobium jaguaris TaxID=1312183 RepID=A0A387FTG1_9HYPH|nr:OmpA family protein [Rhizobium jaguaris]AYG59374.1 hypothetical protein CCGE525_11660 [Rhizobium jaguaris]
MGKRSRLFASAAFPLLSLSLAFEPAAATALREQAVAPLSSDAAKSVAVNGNASFEVAQEQAAPDGQSEEELKKRKKPGGAEQGEPQGQKHEAAPAQQGGGEPQRKMKEAQQAVEPQVAPETQPQGQPELKKHQRQPSESAAPAQQPAEQQPAPAQKQAPAAQQSQSQQAQPEAPAQPELKKHQKQQSQPAAPAQQPAEQQTAPAQKQAPAVQQSQTQQAQPEAPAQPELKKHQKQQSEPAVPAQQPAEQQPVPAQKQAPAAQQSQSQQAQPGTPAQPELKKHQQPQGQPAAPAQQPAEQQAAPAQQQPSTQQAEPGKQQKPKLLPNEQQGGQQPAANTAQQPVQKSEPQAQPQNQAAPQIGKQQQPNVGTAAPAQGNATQAPANGAVQQGAQTAAPAGGQVSPQELERRKKVAENPAASNETVILPVQNGAAVLDSDKDAARRGFRQGGQAAGGQGGQAQTGQAPTAQGQNVQVQQQPAYTKPPTSDAEAQRAVSGQQQQPVRMEAITSEQGRRLDRRPDFAPPEGVAVQPNSNQGGRVILNIDNTYVVRHDDSERFVRDGERPIYEQLPRDRYRETIDRPDGDRIVTVRNRYGDVIQRSRIDARGREYVLFYSPELEDQPDRDDYFRDPGDDLPPMRLRIPVNQYIIDTGTDREANYYDFLREPPVEPVERVYSLNEVRYSARIRDKVRRIDLDTITFATGSAEIPMSQASTLRGVADAMNKIIKKDPTETFLIEGHTDAVGTPQSNLVLSDQRAESVANVLTDVYGIPPENLATQGYGEQYLKVNTQGPEQENRRVTIRRVTALVRPVASTQ